MKLTTISEVSRSLNLSTRALRYYEQLGLIRSMKKQDYAYRVYDEACVQRLRQILLLRKLRIPLKQIKAIFTDEEKARIVDIFEDNIRALDSEIAALNTIRGILASLVSRLNVCPEPSLRLELMRSDEIQKIVEPLGLPKINFKEDISMEELNRANERLNALQDRDVRIVYLPPATVASIRIVGGLPEIETGDLLARFVRETGLARRKPDLRHYGFNNPNGTAPDGSDHGYERWVTIPDDMEVAAPFVKKRFEGGLYCAHTIPMGAFEEWERLYVWSLNNDRYELDFRGPVEECECMEEHLDYIHKHMLPPDDASVQLDLLLPIREKALS
ncbi:MAG TPA: effector binding domain-containing protein [Clostridia bacterium]|nr:MAG: HTH-type transcriptional regulator HmrR [Firmicutes bacterium ADurb.Bin248]HOG01060.1 effector binding domain-containing protein [Clostridia bacterium]HOS18953.1 effector binding domain-containing protein [Clostridia bacterium]HPK15523.1 effector binding domain-containing protein [Clostridia bacterium]